MFATALSEIESRLPWWKARFAAWWDGEDFDPRLIPGGGAGGDPALALAQMTVCQAVWGHGALSPADTALMADLIQPWAEGETERLVFLGAGLGAAVRDLAKSVGARISAFELEDPFVDAATEQCILGGAAKLVSVSLLDPHAPALPESEFDGAILLEPYLRIGSALDLVPECAASVKPGGKVLLLDYTLPAGTWDGGDMAALFGPRIADLPQTADALHDAIEGAGLAILEEADVSEALAAAAAASSEGWGAALKLAEGEEISEADKETLVRVLAEEAAMWAARADAFRTGRLGFQKLLAERPA